MGVTGVTVHPRESTMKCWAAHGFSPFTVRE
jgi:hypothetical protein